MTSARVLTNARVVGSDHGDAVDIAINNGRIAAVSPAGEQVPDAGVEVTDLDGRWVAPGLWDNHIHMNQWALATHRLDVSSAMSAREAAGLVAEALRSSPPALDHDGRPLTFVANGFRDGVWPDAPNLADLDAASPNIPVVVVSFDLHAVWLNTPALERYGLAGHPSGLLREDPAFEIERRVNEVPDAVLDAWVSEAAAAAAARGVVGVVDLEMSWSMDAWLRRQAAGVDALRVEFGIYTQDIDRAIGMGLRTGQRVGELLTVGRHKILTDGSLGTRTAYCLDPYPGVPADQHPHGLLTVPPEELLPLLRRSSDAGILATVHAIGDHANSHVLDVFEQLGVRGGRVEHAQLLAEADIARFGRLGIEASVQPEHAMDDRDIAERHWHGRTERAFMLRSLLDAGATLLLGSDAPVAPLDPWVTMSAAVSRSRDGRLPWHPEQAITTAEALASSVRSSVASSEPADLVVTDENPLEVEAVSLRTMAVAATMLGGRWTFLGL
ncbi:amidohydrolase [Salinibacterium sp. GXW1014]|uniref:amidohydrolase n=1 Tax=Salinibacterium sp. GXW1014 TaxID=3377838 RepID=UPI00383AC644